MMTRWSIASLLAVVAVIAVGLAALREGTEVWAQTVFSLTFGVLIFALLIVVVRRRTGAAWSGFLVCGTGYFLLAFVLAKEGALPRLPTDPWIDRTALRLNKTAVASPILPTKPSITLPTVAPSPPPSIGASPFDLSPPRLPEESKDTAKTLDAIRIEHERTMAKIEEDFALERAQWDKYRAYESALQILRWEYEESVQHTRCIGHCLVSLLLGLVGAVLGRFLAPRERPLSRPDPTNSPAGV